MKRRKNESTEPKDYDDVTYDTGAKNNTGSKFFSDMVSRIRVVSDEEAAAELKACLQGTASEITESLALRVVRTLKKRNLLA